MAKLATSNVNASIASRRATKRSMASAAGADRRGPGSAHVLERGWRPGDLLVHDHHRVRRRERDPRERLHDQVAGLGRLLRAPALVGRRARVVEGGGDLRILEAGVVLAPALDREGVVKSGRI